MFIDTVSPALSKKAKARTARYYNTAGKLFSFKLIMKALKAAFFK